MTLPYGTLVQIKPELENLRHCGMFGFVTTCQLDIFYTHILMISVIFQDNRHIYTYQASSINVICLGDF